MSSFQPRVVGGVCVCVCVCVEGGGGSGVLTGGAVRETDLPLKTAHHYNMPSSLFHHGREQA